MMRTHHLFKPLRRKNMINTIIDTPTMEDNRTRLVILHNAGFFSCCSIALMDIMVYFNQNKGLPDIVDRSVQYMFYKSTPQDNIIPFYFTETDAAIEYTSPVAITDEPEDFQYSDYKKLRFADIKPFVDKFLTATDYIQATSDHFKWKYQLDYDNTCAVFYRGNDKNRETIIAPYSEFISKAHEVLAANPDIKFLVQPDETEFLEAFISEFGQHRVLSIHETPHMRKCDSAMFFELPQEQRSEYGAKFFAAVLTLSKCKHLITHSGNGGLFSVIYRGHGENVHQWLNDKWL